MSDRRSKPKFRERKRKMAVAARVWVYLGWFIVVGLGFEKERVTNFINERI